MEKWTKKKLVLTLFEKYKEDGKSVSIKDLYKIPRESLIESLKEYV